MPSPFDEIDLAMQADVDHLLGEGAFIRASAARKAMGRMLPDCSGGRQGQDYPPQ